MRHNASINLRASLRPLKPLHAACADTAWMKGPSIRQSGAPQGACVLRYMRGSVRRRLTPGHALRRPYSKV